MKKLFLLSIILLIGASLVIGCGAVSPKPTPTPAAPAPITPMPTTAPKPTIPTAPAASPSTSTTPVPKPPAVSPRYGGTLRIITSAAPGTPIGWVAELAGPSSITAQICLDFLLHVDTSGNLNPHLCTSFEANSDPKSPSLTFYLRKGVKFHDGSDFNAQVVKWNLEQSKAGAVNISTTNFWKSFDILDDYTIRVNLTEWQNRLAYSFGGPATLMVSRAAYDKNGVDWMRWHMVGTTAFKQVEFQKDVILKTVRNEDYWEQGKPYLYGLNFMYVADELTRLALFKSGGADILNLGGSYNAAGDLQKAGYQITTLPNRVNFLVPDSMNADSPWSNIKVRMAAEYAIDKDALTKALGFGFAQTAHQLATPTSKAYVPGIAGRKYDPTKAKQLLSEAGYPNGFKTKIIASSTDNRDITVALQSFFNNAGIQTTLEYVEPAKWQTYQTGTWNNACLYTGVEAYVSFNQELAQWWGVPSSWYQSMKKPDGWPQMLRASITSTTSEPALMQKCVQALYDDITIIPTSYGTALWATTDKVHDAGLTDRGSATAANYQYAWLSQ